MIDKRLLFIISLYFNGVRSLSCYLEYKEGLNAVLSLPAKEIKGDVCIISIVEDVETKSLKVLQSHLPEHMNRKFKDDISKGMLCEPGVESESRANCFCAHADYCNDIEKTMMVLSELKKHENIVRRYESIFAKNYSKVLCDRTHIEIGVVVFSIFSGVCVVYGLILLCHQSIVQSKRDRREYVN